MLVKESALFTRSQPRQTGIEDWTLEVPTRKFRRTIKRWSICDIEWSVNERYTAFLLEVTPENRGKSTAFTL
jgi:hypothetical protein